MPPFSAEPRFHDREDAAAAPAETRTETDGAQPRSADNAAMLEEVYRTEAPGLARYFRARLRQSDDAADLVQEAFARLAGFMARNTLPRPGAYLQRIARNLLYDRSKRLEARLAPFHLPIGERTEPAVDADQAHAIEAADVLRLYRQALAQLPEKTRQVFLLHRVEELTYREIGMKLEISIPTVQYHVARALAHIDAALERG
ncbi:RNA polymerase sigma factor [Novosphingobium sp. G106]|uniref:RNA polymerase sigma factor n=1 Tax=Novosphingobium sp. G106 TaxID=2849500 RepID=UPI0020C5A5BE|nr:RNA polymerase sigma factor [Novosphingobium sp. G106]